MSENKTLQMPKPVEEQPEAPKSSAGLFKNKPVTVNLDGVEYNLVYDLNAYCEMETIYPSVDYVIQMLLGTPATDTTKVTYMDGPIKAEDVKIDGQPLTAFLATRSETPKAKYKDTLNLLWLGLLHDHTEFDEDGEVVRYNISKGMLGKSVTLQNMREVNQAIMTALLRDLLPALVGSRQDESKNAEEQEESSQA